jgi:hypothetical protein
MAIEELEQVHTELIEEEKIKTSELPENIRKKIKGWNLLYGRLKNNPDDEKMFNSVQRQSINIADLIQDWLEKEFEEDEEQETPKVDKKEEQTNPKSNEKESKEDEQTSESKQKTAPLKKPFGNLVMEKKILTALKEGNGRIPISTLVSIIGKKPDYPTQVVHKLKLQKIFLVSAYRKI